ESIVQLRSPSHEFASVWRLPESRNERNQHQLLREAHLRMRWHLERAKFDETESTRWAVRRIQLVDANLRAMRIAGHVDEQIAEPAIDQPRHRRSGAAIGNLRESEFEFVQRIEPCFVDAWRLTGRPNEHPREQI